MRREFHVAFVTAITGFLFWSCSSSSKETKTVDLDKIKPEIQAMEDAYAAGEKAKDADKVAAYYSEDAINYRPNEAPNSGKAAIRESIAKRLANDTTGNNYVYKVVDLFGNENMLVEIGSWTAFNPAGTEVDKGHYLSYFEKRDGKWACVRDMNVSSNPARPPM